MNKERLFFKLWQFTCWLAKPMHRVVGYTQGLYENEANKRWTAEQRALLVAKSIG
jgi:hypothetical protein